MGGEESGLRGRAGSVGERGSERREGRRVVRRKGELLLGVGGGLRAFGSGGERAWGYEEQARTGQGRDAGRGQTLPAQPNPISPRSPLLGRVIHVMRFCDYCREGEKGKRHVSLHRNPNFFISARWQIECESAISSKVLVQCRVTRIFTRRKREEQQRDMT